MTELEELEAVWSAASAALDAVYRVAAYADGTAYVTARDAADAAWAAYQAELKKIMAPTVEMTMAEINEALGKNVKVVQ